MSTGELDDSGLDDFDRELVELEERADDEETAALAAAMEEALRIKQAAAQNPPDLFA